MGRAVAFAAVLVLVPAAVACAAAEDAPSSAGATSAPRAGTGPAFERCGGLTLEEVAAVRSSCSG